MLKEHFQYRIVDLDAGRQMLVRFHVGANSRPASTSVGVILPHTPEDTAITITFAPEAVTASDIFPIP